MRLRMGRWGRLQWLSGALALGAACATGLPGPSGATASISINAAYRAAGYDADNERQCATGKGVVVEFKIAPMTLGGGQGLNTVQSGRASFSDLAVMEIGREAKSNARVYGCVASRSFSHLSPGPWLVEVSGAVPAASCYVDLMTGKHTRIDIWGGECQ